MYIYIVYIYSFAPVRRNMAKTPLMRRRQGLDWALNSSRFKEICALGSHWETVGKP